MKSPGEWFYQFANDAYDGGNPADARICATYYQGVSTDDNPAMQLSLYKRARAMADRVGNRRLVLYFDHWCAQCMMHKVRDYSGLLETVVPAVVEVRQPQFDDLPQRFCLQEDLINAYLAIDPIGHQEAIEEALSYFERNVPRDLECRICYLQMRPDFELAKGNIDAAWDAAVESFGEITGNTPDGPSHTRAHHLMFCHKDLCNIAAKREDWEAVVENAVAGLPYSEVVEEAEMNAALRLWQAAGLKGLGQDAAAQRCFHQARGRHSRQPLPETYFDAVSTYHELCGRPHLAFKAREKQLLQIGGQGRFWNECECRLERCRVAKLMKDPELLQTEADALREAADHLKNPQIVTDKLDELLRG